MKLHFLLISLTLCSTTALKAQLYQNTLSGNPYKEQNYEGVKGSPYAFEEWSIGTVQTTKGVFNDINIKYSELDDQVLFKNKDGQTLQFADPVKDFTMSYKDNDKQLLSHYRNGYVNIAGSDNKSYFEVLADGKCQLLRKTVKKIKQEVVYGSTESSKSFITTTRYYIENPEKGVLIKKDKKSVLTVLSDKQQALENYIQSNNIDFKRDEDLVKLINYYNSI